MLNVSQLRSFVFLALLVLLSILNAECIKGNLPVYSFQTIHNNISWKQYHKANVVIYQRFDDFRQLKYISDITALFEYLFGPFAFNISVVKCPIPSSRHYQYAYSNFTLVNVYVKDSLNNALWEYVPYHVSNNLALMKNWLRDRYQVKLTFQLDLDYSEPVTLSWAHFKGNTKIVPIGERGSHLILRPGESTVQYTFAGHLFVCSFVEPFSIENNVKYDDFVYHFEYDILDTNFLNQINWSSIAGLFLVPALSHNEIIYKIRPLDKQFANSAQFYLRNMLLQYWEYQRLAQLNFQFSRIPSLPIVMSSEFVDISISSLWKKISLPAELHSRMKIHHLKNRLSAQSSLEPPISMVFNQHESETRYVPQPSSFMTELEDYIRNQSSLWLGIPVSELDVTGKYGNREYTKGSIIRWHVDPAESQPITAVVHIADDISKASDESSKLLWTLEIPKYSPSMNFIQFTEAHDFNGTGIKYTYSTDNIQSISLEEGEVLLIQSAKLPHSRLNIYKQGSWYANAFVHLSPNNWRYLVQAALCD